MWRGRYALGEIVPLSIQTLSAAVPTLPTAAPTVDIWNDTEKVATFRLPIHDQHATAAWFHDSILLDSRFEPGHYDVIYRYKIGSDIKLSYDKFQIIAGGRHDGAGISMYHYRDPSNSVVLLQGEGGRVLRLRNPRT